MDRRPFAPLRLAIIGLTALVSTAVSYIVLIALMMRNMYRRISRYYAKYRPVEK